MRQDAIETAVLKGEEPLVAELRLPPVGSSPIYGESCATERALNVSALVEQCQREIAAYRRGEPSNDAYGLELLRRAIVQGDHDAWRGVEQCFGELVRGWLHAHPRRGLACHLEREETYVALAFERFWQATIQQQVAFRTLGEPWYICLQVCTGPSWIRCGPTTDQEKLHYRSQGRRASPTWKTGPTAVRPGRPSRPCWLVRVSGAWPICSITVD